MDHLWAAGKLRDFVMKIDQLVTLESVDMIHRIAAEQAGGPTAESVADELISLDPIMRDAMNAARPGFGDYQSPEAAHALHQEADYWRHEVKPWALRALGVHELWDHPDAWIQPSNAHRNPVRADPLDPPAAVAAAILPRAHGTGQREPGFGVLGERSQ